MFGSWSVLWILVVLVFALISPVLVHGAELTLTWVDNSDNEDGFAVERSTWQDGSFAEIATLGPDVASHADSALLSGATYCYRVRAFNTAGYSGYSNESCATAAEDFSLAVVKTGTGSGTVTSGPPGIDCGMDCSEPYPEGTAVALAATPGPDSTFDGWADACSGTEGCSMSLSANTLVTAVFTTVSAPTPALTVRLSGDGEGMVESAPAGILCGVDCVESFSPGATVTLTASPALGSAFGGWKGGPCKGKGNCTVTLSADAEVSATFKRQRGRR